MTRSEYSANQALANTPKGWPQGTEAWAKPAPARAIIKTKLSWWQRLIDIYINR